MNNASGYTNAPVAEDVQRIVVVDDEKRLADTLALILRSAGYVAEVAYDGTSGLALCGEYRPDLVISDVVMPGMSGIALAMEISRELSTCRILLYSGQAETAQMMDEARSRGHEFELLAKPVHPVELLEKVKSLISTPADARALRVHSP
jgi:DNA-binding response OmpR family regulator